MNRRPMMLFAEFLWLFVFEIWGGHDTHIIFNKTSINLGTIIMGHTTSVRIFFRVEGEGGLLRVEAESSCECLKAQLNRDAFWPGERGFLDVEFDSAGYKGDFIRAIRIKNVLEKREEALLSFSGKVVLQGSPDPIIEPCELSFGDLEENQISIRYIQIYNRGDSNLVIVEVSHPPDIAVLLSRKVLIPGTSESMLVVLRPLEAGFLRGSVKFRTNYLYGPQPEVRVSANVRSRLVRRHSPQAP